MRRSTSVVALVVASVLACPVLAQEMAGTVARVGVFTPKPGMTRQFEQGRKKHMEWHRRNNDPSAWFTWEVISGENEGAYVTGTFGHQWKDFDAWEKLDAADTEDANANMGPYLQAESTSYFVLIPEASRPPAGNEPSAMVQVTHFFVKPEKVDAFVGAIIEAKVALDKVNSPRHVFWYRMVTGGEGPHFVLALPRANWADMESQGPPVRELTEAYGPQKAVAIVHAVLGNTTRFYSELLRFRPDLSYVPTKK